MKFVSRLWARAVFIFDFVQYFFNGNFWEVFAEKFGHMARGAILDLGCGTGEMCRYIRPKSYLGIDLNSAYIQYARRRFNNKRFRFLVGDINQQSCFQLHINQYSPEGVFDTAFLIGTAHHLSDSQILKLCKVIKKSRIKTFVVVDGMPVGTGSFLLSFLDRSLAGGKYFRERKELERLIKFNFKLRESGEFKAKRSFYRYPYVVAQNE